MEIDKYIKAVLLLQWSPVTICETRQGCDQDPVPVQTCSLPPSPEPAPAATLPWFPSAQVQHQIPPGIPVRAQPSRVLLSVRRPPPETWRNCSPQRAHCSWDHPLHCFVPPFFFSWVAFCAWTPAIYSVKGKAAFQEGSLEKLHELFGFPCPDALQCCTSESTPPCLFLRVSVVTQLQLQCHWGNNTIKNYKILGLPWIFRKPHARPWQTSTGTTPLQAPEMCWLVPAKEPASRWHFFVITKMNLPPPATKPKDLHYSKQSKVKPWIFHIGPLKSYHLCHQSLLEQLCCRTAVNPGIYRLSIRF